MKSFRGLGSLSLLFLIGASLFVAVGEFKPSGKILQDELAAVVT